MASQQFQGNQSSRKDKLQGRAGGGRAQKGPGFSTKKRQGQKPVQPGRPGQRGSDKTPPYTAGPSSTSKPHLGSQPRADSQQYPGSQPHPDTQQYPNSQQHPLSHQPPASSQQPPVSVSQPSVSVPSQGRVKVSSPSETAVQAQERIIQTEQMREVKRVRRSYKMETAVGVMFGSIEAALTLRLAFKMLGADPTVEFVNFLYQFTNIFAGPFFGIFGGNPTYGQFELDVAAIVAIIIFAIIGFGAHQLVKLF